MNLRIILQSIAPARVRGYIDHVPIQALAGALAAIARDAVEGNRDGEEITACLCAALLQWAHAGDPRHVEAARLVIEKALAAWPKPE